MQVAFLHPAGTTQHEVQVPESSTQFPTHDAFPRPVAPLARGDETALGPALPRRGGPTATEGVVAHIDGYGNLPTLLPPTGNAALRLGVLPGRPGRSFHRR